MKRTAKIRDGKGKERFISYGEKGDVFETLRETVRRKTANFEKPIILLETGSEKNLYEKL